MYLCELSVEGLVWMGRPVLEWSLENESGDADFESE